MKAFYDASPSPLEAVGDNKSFRYRWNIQEVAAPTMQGEEPRTQFACDEVVVFEPISADKVKSAVIDELYGGGVEQKLQNDYNAAKEGVFVGEKAAQAIADYTTFLNARQALKAEVDAVFEALE